MKDEVLKNLSGVWFHFKEGCFRRQEKNKLMFVKNKGENAYKSPINCKHVKRKALFWLLEYFVLNCNHEKVSNELV